MGQKVNPIGFRLVRKRDWRSKWFANKQEFGNLLVEDHMIRAYLMKKPAFAGDFVNQNQADERKS